jgi:fructose-bisphosphate aldolase class I
MSIENNEENRRYYRQLLFRTKESTQYISGIILCHETFYHKTDDDDTPFPRLVTEGGIVPGITVDRGLIVLGGTDNETITQGKLREKNNI